MLTDTVLMIRPANFSYNAETAETNAFQQQIKAEELMNVQTKAIEEFNAFVHTIMELLLYIRCVTKVEERKEDKI